jgi:hypothetical protein
MSDPFTAVRRRLDVKSRRKEGEKEREVVSPLKPFKHAILAVSS